MNIPILQLSIWTQSIELHKKASFFSISILMIKVLLLSPFCQAIISNNLVVSTTSGKIQGATLRSASNKEVSVWYGVKYAVTPTGSLRFQLPKPVVPWNGIRKTTEKPNSCVQVPDNFFPGFKGAEVWNPNTKLSEDCLYLSVAVPKPHPTKAAVMIWIHGGGFTFGTSTLDLYDIKTLASEENVIVVQMQYRLNSLGFLYFGTNDAPGNVGLYDQRLAMQWVKDNIAQFGGDPQKITIFGDSAGAASVGYHLLSPKSSNLFNRAIMQSGSPLAEWAITSKEESFRRSLKLASLVNCPSNKHQLKEVLTCLRNKNASLLAEKSINTLPSGYQFVQFPFTPVVDGEFLTETPEKKLKTKNFKRTQILTGITADEGNWFLFYWLSDIIEKKEDVFVSREEFQQGLKQLASHANQDVLEQIEYLYTNSSNPDNRNRYRKALDLIMGDYVISCPTLDFSNYYGDDDNAYVYYFDQRPSNSPWPTWSGALHGDEVAFVSGQPLNRTLNYNQAEIGLSQQIMSFWASFSKTGNPCGSQNACWPRYSSTNRVMHKLTAAQSKEDEKIVHDTKASKCVFWKTNFPRTKSPPKFTGKGRRMGARPKNSN